jgi:HlyD family secretion protein
MPLLSRMRAPGPGQHPHTIAAIGALAGIVAILVFLILGSGVPPPSAPGVVHTTEIKIAPEISGRLSRFAVTPGQGVHAGAELATLVNPELSASLVLANAELGQARAQRDNVYAGVRQEEVDMLGREIETAKADLLYAEQQFARKSALAADGFASRQDLDQASAGVGTARARLEHAQEAYQAARLGPIREELAVADAKVKNAEAVVSVIAARVDKLRIRAPSDGTVALIVAEPGEAIVPGQPVMTLEAAGRRWASFNLREDQLDGLHIGSPIELLPIGGSDRIQARIAEIIPRGEFATWRAARVVGDHDLNTFLVRADPVTPASEALQPGMSVWLEPASHTVRSGRN